MVRNASIVAIVDDDAGVLESLQSLLELAGHGVRTFRSAKAFLRYAESTTVDCLISDIRMPVTDGFELRRLVHARCPGLPVILMTGGQDRRPAGGLDAEERCPLLKPLDGGELLRTVAAALRSAGAGPGRHGA